MKKTIIRGILALFIFTGFVGCAGMSIGLKENTLTLLQTSATSTIGYLIAKNNPQYIPDILEWYSKFNNLEEFGDIQTAFSDGTTQLATLISDDPYLQLQIRNAMTVLEIKITGPELPEEITKYKAVVDSFMLGVMSVQIK